MIDLLGCHFPYLLRAAIHMALHSFPMANHMDSPWLNEPMTNRIMLFPLLLALHLEITNLLTSRGLKMRISGL
jgi:hypothetical protein